MHVGIDSFGCRNRLSVERWETLAAFAEGGFDTLIFRPVDATSGQIELLVGKIAPVLEGR